MSLLTPKLINNWLTKKLEQEIMARKPQWYDYPPEIPKDDANIPDSLGIGTFERKMDSGGLAVYFEGDNTTLKRTFVVLGKYAQPTADGSLFFVTERWAKQSVTVKKFDSIITAVSHIVLLKEAFDADRAGQAGDRV